MLCAILDICTSHEKKKTDYQVVHPQDAALPLLFSRNSLTGVDSRIEHFTIALERSPSRQQAVSWLCRCFHPFSPASSPSLFEAPSTNNQGRPFDIVERQTCSQQRGKTVKKDNCRIKQELWQHVPYMPCTMTPIFSNSSCFAPHNPHTCI